MQEIYFDNSATTLVSEEAAAAALASMRENYGNPSSLHGRGVAARRLLEDSRQALARAVGAAAEEIIFTASGSEANNMALLGVAQIHARRGGRILLTAAEHPSLLEPARYLAAKDYDVQYIPVNAEGLVEMAALEDLLTPQTIFVGLHQVNNETGAMQPLAQIGALLRRYAPEAHYHVDAVQALGKLPIDAALWQADTFALSGHKIHAPKGVGALWLAKKRRLPALIRGGGQERDLRSGTENMPGIAAFAVAAQSAVAQREQNVALMRQLKLALAAELLTIEGAVINGPLPDAAAPHILNISFPGAKSEVLLHMLEGRGLFVSAGSACSSHRKAVSHVLLAMNLSPERCESALRFSFSALNRPDEVQAAAATVRQAVTELRAMKNKPSRR